MLLFKEINFQKLLFVFAFAVLSTSGFAQDIKATNIEWKVVDELVVINYDLPVNDQRKEVSITLKRTSDPGFKIIPRSVTGDVGMGEFSGPGRKIYWDYKKDVPEGLKGSDYFFEIAVVAVNQDKAREIKEKQERTTEGRQPNKIRIAILADWYSAPAGNYVGLEMVGGGGILFNYIIPAGKIGVGVGASLGYMAGEFGYLNGAGTKWTGTFSEVYFKPQLFLTNLMMNNSNIHPYYRAGLALSISSGTLSYDDGTFYSKGLTRLEVPIGGGVAFDLGEKVGVYTGLDLYFGGSAEERKFQIEEEGGEVSVGKKPFVVSSLNFGFKF